MPKIDIASVAVRTGAGYPAPFDTPCAGRMRRRLGDAGGLHDFGVNLMTLPPGGWSSQRHWHSDEDEFVYVLQGELKLVEDNEAVLLRAGECAAFPQRHGQRASPDQRVPCPGRVSGGRVTPSGRSHHVLRHRHEEFQCDGRFVHKDGSPYP